jgi:cytochrome c oxidase assembly protein subunit 15
MLAYFTGITLVVLALRTWLADSDARLRRAGVLLLGAITLQIVLGISTVLSRVDVAIAAGHQSGAVVLLTTVLFWVHCKRTTDRGDVAKR